MSLYLHSSRRLNTSTVPFTVDAWVAEVKLAWGKAVMRRDWNRVVKDFGQCVRDFVEEMLDTEEFLAQEDERIAASNR